MVTSSVVNTYPLSSYSFGTKEPKMEKDTSVADRLARMKLKYAFFFLFFPFIIMYHVSIYVQFCACFGCFKQCGKKTLEAIFLAFDDISFFASSGSYMKEGPVWLYGGRWRPNFETIMYPYCPPHISKPKVKDL
ncbi:hypothetical protein LXL04_006408 [Taraxacum kok-saghyz]